MHAPELLHRGYACSDNGRLTGAPMLSEGTSLSYTLEYARQSDYEDGSNIGADYWLA